MAAELAVNTKITVGLFVTINNVGLGHRLSLVVRHMQYRANTSVVPNGGEGVTLRRL